MNFIDLLTNKKLTSVSSWLVFILCSVIMGIMSHFSGWTPKVLVVLGVNAVVMTTMTFHPRVTIKAQALTLTLLTFINIFTCSYVEKNLYPSIAVFVAASVLIASYKDVKLVITYMLLILGGIIYHVFYLETVPLYSAQDISVFLVRVLIMYTAMIYMLVIIKVLNVSEQELVKSVEEAKQAERYKSDFLANMSHEIRTPMNAIVGMCELILRENNISDTVRDNCFNIQTSGRSLLSIINDILDFSKIESGKMELVYEEFNIASTLNDVINMTEARKGDKKLDIIVKASPDLPRGLVGDEVRIRQIMINLMTNAVKFTSEGSVTLTVAYTKQDYGINLFVSVADTGIGISEENIEKLFTSFRQVDTKKNRSVEGTGLGLAISKSLVNAMGGFISVKSRYGAGSDFRFVVPLKVSDPEPFVTVKEPEKLRVGVCFGLDNYNKRMYAPVFEEISAKLGVHIRRSDCVEELLHQHRENPFTHVFVDCGEYLADEESLAKLSEVARVFVVQERADAVNLPEGIRCVYKPFYSVSIASALNNENLLYDLYEHHSADIRFTAPKARVLIVDDNVINLKVAVGLMRPYNMQLITAESGAAAIRMLRSADIDLVFMDHMMPEMDGVEATKIIRSMEGKYYRKLPIIALTANAVNGAREMFMESGFNDFLAKPIELSALDKLLKSYLPKKYIQPAAASAQPERRNAGRVKTADMEALFDIEKGLSYIGGDEDTYREIVALYVKKSGEKLEYIRSLCQQEDWKNYVIEVHALKSTSLNIGAVKLSELARELEAAGKSGSYATIEKKNEDLLSLYEQTAAAAAEYLGENTEEDEPQQESEVQLAEIEPERLGELLKRAEEACESFDSDILDEIAAETEGLSFKGKPLKEYFGKAAELADDFEYDAAAETLRQLREEMEVTD